jgi:hypothetical protein
MVTTDKANWVSNLNIDLGGIASTRLAQYQTTLIRLKEFFLNANWTTQGSSNGSTASTSDNWASNTTNIVAALSGSARSWYAFGAPNGATFANNTVGTYSILLEASATTQPNLYQSFNIYVSTTAFNMASATTTVLPVGTAAGTSGSAPTARVQNMPYLAAADTPVQAYLNTWTNAAGDLYFVLKQTGAPGSNTTRFSAFVDATLARTNSNRMLYWLLTNSSFNSMSSFYGFSTENLTAITVVSAQTRAATLSNWPGGQDSTGNLGYFPTFVYNNGNSSVTARDYGRLQDLWSLPGLSPDNASDATDTEATRLLTFADIALPTTYAQAPIS